MSAEEPALELLVVEPSEPHRATVIFLHGLGQTAQSWLDRVKSMADQRRDVKWILPQSKSMRVTKDSSETWRPAWFDVLHLPPCPNCSVVGSEASLTQITRIIEDESRLLTEPKSVFLVGFSQGAALSMVLSLTTLIDLGGVASLSGWIPHHCRPGMAVMNPSLPVFWGHGTDDREVPLGMGQECINFLRRELRFSRHKITSKTYMNLDHNVNNEELRDVCEWLSRLLAQGSTTSTVP